MIDRNEFREYLERGGNFHRRDARQCPIACYAAEVLGAEQPFVAGGLIEARNMATGIVPDWARAFIRAVDETGDDPLGIPSDIKGKAALAILDSLPE